MLICEVNVSLALQFRSFLTQFLNGGLTNTTLDCTAVWFCLASVKLPNSGDRAKAFRVF